MSHGFDEEGRLRDAGGSVRGGWGAAETDEFERRVAELVEQAGCWCGTLDGRRTCSEAIADLTRQLTAQCHQFAVKLQRPIAELRIEFSVVAKYQDQSWQIVVPFDPQEHTSHAALSDRFHNEHERFYHHKDPASAVSFLTWQALATCPLQIANASFSHCHAETSATERLVHFAPQRSQQVSLMSVNQLDTANKYRGPCVIETGLTTIVVDERYVFRRTPYGSIIVYLN